MTYQVIKTIKGKPYLYEQSTYRENGKVKTISRYIGAVDPTSHQVSIKPTVQSQEAQTTHDINEVVGQVKEPPEQAPDKLTLQQLTLHIRTDLNPHKIGQLALEREYFSFTKQQQERGLKPNQIPPISIVKGSKVEFKKSSSGYLVSLPKKQQPGGRADFWRTFRKATAHSYLDAIAKQDPQYFEGLKANLKTSYKQQNHAISAYIMHSKRKDVFKIGLTLHFLYSKTVSTWTQKHLPPEKIGLSDYSNRSTWRNDTAVLMGEIQKEGWRSCYKKYTTELQRVENYQFKLLKEYKKIKFLDRLSGKQRAIKKDILKINARRRAIFATCDKIMTLAPLYQGYRGESVESEFIHDSNWKQTRNRWRGYFNKN